MTIWRDKMLRNDYDISDEEFGKIMEPFEAALCNYIANNFIYDYLAFYIATGYRMDALWDGDLVGHVNSAFDSICDVEYKYGLDYKHLKKVIKKQIRINH